jgi:hypothetical protein
MPILRSLNVFSENYLMYERGAREAICRIATQCMIWYLVESFYWCDASYEETERDINVTQRNRY